MERLKVMAALGICIACLCGVGARAGDWPRWRGPSGDGISPETNWRPEALATGPSTVWRAEVGKGYAAVSISGGRACTMGNTDDTDHVIAMDAATGRELWRYSYPCKAASYPGPRAAPVFDRDRVYTVSREGQVHCLAADTGKVLWTRQLRKDLGARLPRWGISSAVLVDGRAVYLNAASHGVALDKTTGQTLWQSPAGTGGYAVPVIATLGGQTQLLVFGEKAIHGVAPESGQRLWDFEWVTRHDVNAADPAVAGNQVFITSGYGRGCALLDCEGSSPRKLWENKALAAHFSSPIMLDGHIYGVHGNTGRGDLVCMRLDDGQVVWRESLGFGSLILAGKHLIVLNERGRLFVVEATPEGYREVGAADSGLSARCWTPPSLSDGLLYLRNDKGSVVCINLK